MIDLFNGSLGSLNNKGGSRIFSIPHTINIGPDYEIYTQIDSQSTFVSCSLDGRLWVFSDKLLVLNFNNNTEKLEIATSRNFNDEIFIARGLDWILTNKSFIQALDDDPYFWENELFDDNTSLSFSSIDLFYSFLPPVGDWQIIKNYLVKRYGNTSQKSLRAWTPLEINYYSENNIEAYTASSPFLFYFNGNIWGKGHSHIGKVFFLPRTFNESGEAEDFYLYISPDYLRQYENGAFNDNDNWQNMILFPANDHLLYGVLPKQDNEALCLVSKDNNVFSPQNKNWYPLSGYQGNLFFDTINSKTILLDKIGITFLHNNSKIECKSINQWVAPEQNIDYIFDDFFIAPCNSGALATQQLL